ncbi:hypothetical protein CHLNCDRAFT_141741 [Chlorella variabilis]|uniref:HAUS augmin-like complex subunit 6 N-terminal domain-containing protein n=1 Tax=Chlorella variabilis TaxID=554065 RepID=E1ZTH8_CHLVA|nr:hypothetical protein CHLNCDRAFT_141741 [Chlorella variabilis]EFN50811.1 hypothetical protein CHLNCDRAFT_141741 [Chlorella variabilis]|eukprot:XP_005842913.1 hypothetical protein CHLNCDRAFT_141741 [Chlorella variabilis]
MERQLQHRRLQHEAIAASTATTLYGALVYLNRGGLCKEPLSPAMFARPNLKGLQAVLHLLHHRIRGAARTKKELQHVYPVLEPGQGREFKAVMQGWIRELGEAGLVLPDTVKYFVTAYQGSNSHRTVLMLLDLSTVALGRELGEGPQAGLPGVELVQPHAAAVVGRLPRGARQAAAAAQRELQARMDEVVAAMQRLKQLQAQAAGQLAAGHAASGAAAAQLAPHVPPLFSASQAAARRGELVLELLSHGPPLTVQPEAVRPDSWADLLAAGKAGVATGEGAAASPAVAARRLSNPAQEASNFAAEGLAADADVITVHGVLTQRLHAAGAALQAAVSSGAPPGAPEVQATLAEAAVYRESLMLSVWQELAAAQIRSEQRAPAETVGRGSFAAGGGGQAGTADSGGMSIDALMQRLKLLPSKGPR